MATKKSTLRDKVLVAHQAVSLLRSYAIQLRQEAKEFDCTWPYSIAEDMSNWVEELSDKLK